MTIERVYVPRPPLSDVIDLFWRFDGYVSTHEKERVLPTGAMQIVISLRSNGFRVYDADDTASRGSFSGTILVGPYAESTVINTADVFSTIGIAFKPGGGRPFFRFPAHELRNREADLDAIWGAAAANELRERLLEAGEGRGAGVAGRGAATGGAVDAADGARDAADKVDKADKCVDAQFAVLEAFLLERAVWPRAGHPAVAFALAEFDRVPHTRTIGDVTQQIGLSRRRFIELFENAVGLTPKRFCRLRRFQEVVGSVARGGRVEWAAVASACGYFDQAHLINDFRSFSGLTPGDYLRLRTPYQNHVRID